MSISNIQASVPPEFFEFHEDDVKHTLVIGPSRAGMTVHSSFLHGRAVENAQNFLRVGRKINSRLMSKEASQQPYYRRFAKNKY